MVVPLANSSRFAVTALNAVPCFLDTGVACTGTSVERRPAPLGSSAGSNGAIIRIVMEPKYWVLRCKVLRKIACPDRPHQWACYSVDDWKQMTEAEWNALPELPNSRGHAA
jgi:hypothetical protein